jgi:pyruvate/2-oxoglutarate dehydrogenase complex dihydrolipoamide acyltransferase (E2) component
MGKSAEALAKEHGTVKVVVLHNAISYRDPDDVATNPADYVYRTAYRGETIEVDKSAAERLFSLGSVAEEDTTEAGFAKAGMRDPSVLASPPSATAMTSPESEQVQALKAVLGDRVGDPASLYKLDDHQLKQVAVAFGVSFKENDSKDDLIAKLTDPEMASAARASAEQAESARGTAQLQADLSPDEQLAARSGSGDVQATDAAKKLASEKGVDLSQVKGTGKDGQIGQPDVVKYLADHDG